MTFGQVAQWQKEMEVRNVGTASPFYAEIMGQQATPVAYNTGVRANVSYNPFGADPRGNMYPGGQAAFVPSVPSVTQSAGYNPYGHSPHTAKTTLPQTHQSPDATMARIVNTIDQYKDQIARISQHVIDKYSGVNIKPEPVRASVLPPSRAAQQSAFSATNPLQDTGVYKRAGVGGNVTQRPQPLTQQQRTALADITTPATTLPGIATPKPSSKEARYFRGAPAIDFLSHISKKKTQPVATLQKELFSGIFPNYSGGGNVEPPAKEFVLDTATEKSPRHHVYFGPEYGYTDQVQFVQSQGLHGDFGAAYDVYPLVDDRTKIPVVAVKSGDVVFAGDTGAVYGNVIIVRDIDNPNIQRVYSHQSSNAVQAGDRVTEGQIIGRFGKTGSVKVTGTHLHYETVAGGQFNSNTFQFEGSQPLTPAERTEAYERLAYWYGLQ